MARIGLCVSSHVWELALIGLLVGVAVGALGAGGSLLAVPLLVQFGNQGIHRATTVALGMVAVSAAAALPRHLRAGRTCLEQAAALAAPVAVGAVAGAFANGALSAQALTIATAVALLVGALAIASGAPSTRRGTADAASLPTGDARCPPLRRGVALGTGLSLGALTGMLGIGGGFLALPILVRLQRVPVRAAAATASLVVGVAALVGLVAHLAVYHRAPLAAWALALPTCVVGGALGARVAERASGEGLKRATVLLLALLAVLTLLTLA